VVANLFQRFELDAGPASKKAHPEAMFWKRLMPVGPTALSPRAGAGITFEQTIIPDLV
jgi:hypothetical protein